VKISRVARLGRIGVRAPREPVGILPPLEAGSLTGGGVRQLNLMPKGLRAIARRIGEKRARRVWRLQKKGVEGTLPELITYDWLERRQWVFEFETSALGGRRTSGGAVLDFLIYGLSANGLYVWRIQGEYWHQGPEVERKDFAQAARLLRVRIGGVPIVAVVDLWENDVYDRYPAVFEKAEMGVGLRR